MVVPSTERIMVAAYIVSDLGYADVAAWMQQQLAHKIVDERPRRLRTVRVRLARNNREMLMDADVVKRGEAGK